MGAGELKVLGFEALVDWLVGLRVCLFACLFVCLFVCLCLFFVGGRG